MARKRVSENPIIMSTGGAAVPVRRKSATNRATRPDVPVEASDTDQIEPSVIPVEPVAEMLSPSALVAPSYQEVARLAYLYWEARGYQGGSPEEDWLRAEQELYATSAK
jgi:hypothetical protein